MRHLREPITFIILMVLASNAAAVTNKCTDANGTVIYTNTACPSGYEAKSVGENVSVVNGNPAFSQQELDQMLAPIALYPDSLLSVSYTHLTLPTIYSV